MWTDEKFISMSAVDPNNKIRQGWQKYKGSAICRPFLTGPTLSFSFYSTEGANSSLKCRRRNMDNEGSMMMRWKYREIRYDFRQLCTNCILFLIRPARLFMFGQ